MTESCGITSNLATNQFSLKVMHFIHFHARFLTLNINIYGRAWNIQSKSNFMSVTSCPVSNFIFCCLFCHKTLATSVRHGCRRRLLELDVLECSKMQYDILRAMLIKTPSLLNVRLDCELQSVKPWHASHATFYYISRCSYSHRP